MRIRAGAALSRVLVRRAKGERINLVDRDVDEACRELDRACAAGQHTILKEGRCWCGKENRNVRQPELQD